MLIDRHFLAPALTDLADAIDGLDSTSRRMLRLVLDSRTEGDDAHADWLNGRRYFRGLSQALGGDDVALVAALCDLAETPSDLHVLARGLLGLRNRAAEVSDLANAELWSAVACLVLAVRDEARADREHTPSVEVDPAWSELVSWIESGR